MVLNEKSIALKVKFANYLEKAFTFPDTFAITFVKHNQYCVTWIYPGFIYDMALYGQIIVLICAPSTFFIFGLYLIKKKQPDITEKCKSCIYVSLWAAYLSGIVFVVFYLCLLIASAFGALVQIQIFGLSLLMWLTEIIKWSKCSK